MKLSTFFLGAVFAFNYVFGVALAAGFDADIMLPQNHVRFSEEVFIEGKVLRVYVTAVNNGARDLLGAVRLTVNGLQVGSDQPISVLLGRTDSIFIDWKINSPGKKTVKVTIIPWETNGDDPSNNTYVRDIIVLADTDRDGVPNVNDGDDDNDGVIDAEDAFPTDGSETVDSDGDKIGDNKDDDDDNDGVKDADDLYPLDPDESEDSDGDGIGNRADTDDDGDGLDDEDEDRKQTDALNPDTDGDLVLDGEDAFPLDPNESSDFDGDNLGDNSDSDDDNDGIADYNDTDPKNKGPIIEPNFLKIDGTVGSELSFVVPSVRDEDGVIAKYEWYDENGDKVSSSKEPEEYVKAFADVGTYELSLRVYDDKGEYRTADFQVTVFKSRLGWYLLFLLLLLLLALMIGLKYLREAKNRGKASKKATKTSERNKK